MDNFWGQRNTQSKGMRFKERLIWHYFTYKTLWQKEPGYSTACRANWDDNIQHTLAKQTETPSRKDCCADCWRLFKKMQSKPFIREGQS